MKTLSKKAQKQQERDEAIARLRSYLNPGDTVYCVLRHVSRSGMQRHIDLYAIKDGTPVWLSSFASRAMDYPATEQGALKVGGCGMDMGFHIVYHLSRTLFPDGFKVEGRGRNGDTSGWDNDGGYALKHSWM